MSLLLLLFFGSLATAASLESSEGVDVVEGLDIKEIWKAGHRGKGVRVAIFDTGLSRDEALFPNIWERSQWTNEASLDDLHGHGTFVAGVVGGAHPQCAGIAPDAELYIFRVFTHDKTSYTSWFLDAMNYALQIGVDVLNLSIGSSDYLDIPFSEKVRELTSSGIIVVSAIGNDGPSYGTLNSPADQSDVIGVGGYQQPGGICEFSSRGMTLSDQFPLGYGRVKPDLVAPAKRIRGIGLDGKCKLLAGTSVASPIVSGALALLMSSVPPSIRKTIFNPAGAKQLLLETASKLPGAPSMFEQGAGSLNVKAAFARLSSGEFVPHVSVIPEALLISDVRKCDVFSPWCSQPLFYTGIPLIVNFTLLNSRCVSSRVVEPRWIPIDPEYSPVSVAFQGTLPLLWPWSGWIGVKFSVEKSGERFEGVVSGRVAFDVECLGAGGGEKVEIPVELNVIPPVPRERRLLWDVFHQHQYPPSYIPQDNLAVHKSDQLDWKGDHPHTNFKMLWERLLAAGFYVDPLASPYTCVDSGMYGAVLLIDIEMEFHPSEREKLVRDVKNGMGLVILGEWFDPKWLRGYTRNVLCFAFASSSLVAVDNLIAGATKAKTPAAQPSGLRA